MKVEGLVSNSMAQYHHHSLTLTNPATQTRSSPKRDKSSMNGQNRSHITSITTSIIIIIIITTIVTFIIIIN